MIGVLCAPPIANQLPDYQITQSPNCLYESRPLQIVRSARDRWSSKTFASPVPGPGEVVVSVKAASLNFPDLLIIAEQVPDEAAAAVLAGQRVRRHRRGGRRRRDAREARRSRGGVLRLRRLRRSSDDRRAAHACRCRPGFDFDDAAAFVLTYATTHHALLDRGALKAGETLLVLGAAGGVGLAAIQIGKIARRARDRRASSDEKLALCREIGADETINYTTGKIRERSRR